MKRATLLFAMVVLAAAACPRADAREPLVVTAERDGPGGHEQLALIFRDDGAELVANSNFLSPQSSDARLGRYKSPLTASLKTRWDMLEAAHERLPAAGGALHDDVSSHAVRFFIDEQELARGTMGQRIASETLGRAWERADWSPIHAIRIELKKQAGTGAQAPAILIKESEASKTSQREVTEKQLGCRAIASRAVVCATAFGQAYLRR